MNLLDAVNLMLEAVGEHPVSSADIRHPTVSKARKLLTQTRQQLLIQGYWFNTANRTLVPDVSGIIGLPVTILSLRPTTNLQVAVRGERLYNTIDDTYQFTMPIECEIISDMEFEDMPFNARYAVANRAAIQLYGSDIGLDSNVGVYQENAAQAMVSLDAEHVKQRRYSAQNRASWRSLQYARRG